MAEEKKERSTLSQIGSGLGTAIGVPLTGLAMVQAARSGRDPLAVLRSAMGTPEAMEPYQQEQLKRQGLMAQIEAGSDPRKAALLRQSPQLAAALGFPIETVSSASADFPTAGEGVSVAPQGALSATQRFPVIPEVPLTPQDQAAQARTDYFKMLTGMLGPQAGQGQMPSPGVGGTSGGPSGSQWTITGMGPSGPTFGPVPTQTLPQGTMGPEGEIQPGQMMGGKQALILPPKTTAQQKAKVNLYQGFVDRIDNFTKEFPPEERAQLAGAMNYATNRAQGIGAMIAPGFIEPDKTRFNRFKAEVASIRRFLFEEGGKQLTGNEIKVLNDLLPSGKELAGVPEFEDKLISLRNVLAERLNVERGGMGATSAGTPAGVPPGTAAGISPSVLSARDRVKAMGQPPVARAKGGEVKPGQMALVGERGPELSISGSPRTIVPLQQMAASDAEIRAIQRAQQANSARMIERAQQAPMQGSAGGGFQGSGAPAAPRTVVPLPQVPGGLSRGGVGLSPEDAARATGDGFTVTTDQNGNPILVPR